MAAKASPDHLMLFCIYDMAGQGRFRQHDRSRWRPVWATWYARLGMSEVAAAVGIFDLRTFGRSFRRRYGMTPGGWRRQHLHAASAPATLT